MKEFLYSRNAVCETLRARRRQFFDLQVAEGAREKGRLLEILQQAEVRKLPIRRVSRTALDRVNPDHQGVLLEVSGYPYVTVADILDDAARKGEPPFVLVLDSLQDPQNFGTLLRSAESAGIHGVILPLAHSVQVTPAVVNASSGASEHLLIAMANLAQAIETLKEAGAWVIGLAETGTPWQDSDPSLLKGGLALVVGSEGEGLRPLVSAGCDRLLSLPMRGRIASLNAAVAGSVALYLAAMARSKAPSPPSLPV